MNEDKKYFYRHEIPAWLPDEGKQYELQAARRIVSQKLFDILYENRLPAVVDIKEIIEPDDNLDAASLGYLRRGATGNDGMYGPFPRSAVAYHITISPVQQKRVTMVAQDADYFSAWRKEATLADRVKRFFRR